MTASSYASNVFERIRTSQPAASRPLGALGERPLEGAHLEVVRVDDAVEADRPAEDSVDPRRERRRQDRASLEAGVCRVADHDAVRASGQLRERRDVGDHEVDVVRVDDRQLRVRIHGAAPEAREVLQAGREARAREAVQEDHPADHDVLGMEAEAPAFEDDRTGARLPEVEARARSPRRSPGGAPRGP